MNIFGLPSEVVLMIFNTLIGGFLGIQKAKQDAEAARDARQHQMMLELAKVNHGAYSEARAFEKQSPGFAWTRRVIALGGIFFIIIWPKLVAVFWPETAIALAYFDYVEGSNIPFLSTPGREGVHWTVMQGLMITPLDTHLVAAIIGLFFGHEIVKRR
jgi:hypothetical protein